MYLTVYHVLIIISCNLEKLKCTDLWLKVVFDVGVLLAKSLK